MNELFNKRMALILDDGNVGHSFVEKTNLIVNKTFENDQNFRRGMLYDWDMNELEMVDFKFEKKKEYSAGGYETEYYIHFRPNFNPESFYKDRYFKKDNKERLGFFIDVRDYSKNKTEKWLIVGKDDRVAFDRYNAFKCNWCLEWVYNGRYYTSLSVIRSSYGASDASYETNSELGGSTVKGSMTVVVPSSLNNQSIRLGTRFMISDSVETPQCYEVVNKIDTSSLGVTALYLKQCLFNNHKDVYGVLNDMTNISFDFSLPIDDLPGGFGGSFHMICDCIKSKDIVHQDTIKPNNSIKLSGGCDYLYVNGEVAMFNVVNCAKGFVPKWHIFIDGIEYQVDELKEYFDISVNDKALSIRAINRKMAKYIVKIAIYDEEKTYYDFMEMEVCI